jgi:transketolase C-terminal domain/subunit
MKNKLEIFAQKFGRVLSGVGIEEQALVIICTGTGHQTMTG